jgi:hypothetical protein
MKRSIIKTLLSNIQENRRKIVKDNSTSEEFINLYRKQKDGLLKKEEREEKWNSRHLELSKLMKNPKDYTIIDDLYTKISERNEKIKTLPEYDKKEVNSECFNLMEKALDIEWNNYRLHF